MAVPSVLPAPSTRPQACAPQGRSVLLVDDEPAYIDLLHQLLSEHLSCPVHCFTKPAEALKAFPNLNVGLVVTDYQMPEIDGLQLISEVQRMNPLVPAVMITAYQTNFTEAQLARVPALKVVVKKPFKWTVLAGHIRQYWEGSAPPFPISGGA